MNITRTTVNYPGPAGPARAARHDVNDDILTVGASYWVSLIESPLTAA